MFGGLCGFVALLSLLRLIPIKDIFSVDKNEYIYERLTFNIWLLQVILLIVGLAVAVLGIIGYRAIKEEAVRIAIKGAKEEFNARFSSTSKRPNDSITSKSDERFGQESPSQAQLDASEEEE